MDTFISVETNKASTILAYGTASNSWRWVYFILGALGLLTIATLIGIWMGLRVPVAIPSRTALLIKVTPAQARERLSVDMLNQLPKPWRTALNEKTWWPAILGAYRTETGWHTYAILPRWLPVDTTLARKSSGLMALIADGTHLTGTNPFRYGDLSNNGILFTPTFAFLPDPEASTIESTPTVIRLTLKKDRLSTDMPFKTTETPLPLRTADLSVDLSSSPDANDLVQALLAELPHTGINLDDPTFQPTQINLTFDEDGRPAQTLLGFGTPISPMRKQQLLASFGLTGRRSMRLADGSVVLEESGLDLAASSSTAFSTALGPLEIGERELKLGTSTNPMTEITSSCPGVQGWVRLSGRAIGLVLKSVDVLTNSRSLSAVSIGSERGKMGICLER